MIELKPRTIGWSTYGYFDKPHYKLIKKIPMSMSFIDEKGFMYTYLPKEKLYFCFASCLTLHE